MRQCREGELRRLQQAAASIIRQDGGEGKACVPADSLNTLSTQDNTNTDTQGGCYVYTKF